MRVKPGHNAVTWTPDDRTSSCIASVKERTKAFVAEYVAFLGPGWKLAVDATLSRLPERRGTIASSAA